MIRWIKSWAAGLAASAMLVACGGGGGDSGSCTFDCDPVGGTSVDSLVITLSSQSLSNSGSDVITATITALNEDRVAVSDATVSVAVDANAVASPSGTTTDANGVVTATVGIGSDKANRIITLTAVSGSVEQQVSFQVTGARISSTYTGTVAANSVGNTVVYQLTDVNGTPMAGQEISVSAPGLTTAEGTTDSSGRFTFTYNAPATAGELAITAESAGVTDVANVVVQSAGIVPPAVGPVGSASVAVNPNKVTVNIAGGTSNQAQVRVLFVRPDNSAIPNVRVRFDLNGDPNRVGGTFSSGSDTLYSSANGTVTAAYIPGTRSSPTDGVSVRACYSLTDFTSNTDCPNSVSATLTVTDEAISVSLGTNELIEEGDADLTYIKRFVVLVVDSAGNAMPGVTITPVVDLTNYAKGRYVVSGDAWAQAATAVCINEDVDRDGILDLVDVDGDGDLRSEDGDQDGVLDASEDLNGNGVLDPGEDEDGDGYLDPAEDGDGDGVLDLTREDFDRDSVLEPRKADVSIRMVDSDRTDASGLAVLQIEYPKNVASWVRYMITVTASGISGTEGRATFAGWLPVPADAVSSTDSSPAFVFSPYGEIGSCTDPR